MKKDFVNIDLKTLQNGYSLSVNGEDFMYFNETDLLAGFMAHVGMQESKALERGTLLSNLFSAMMGEAYADAVSTLKQRVGLLTSKYEATLEQMDNSIAYVNQAEKTVNGFKTTLEQLNERIKAVGSHHKEVSEALAEAKKKLDEMARKSDKVMNQLANSATIMKAIEETGKKKAQGKAAEANSEVVEAVSEGEPNNDTAVGEKHKKRTRKDNDRVVLRELEKQAKENPNIK